jgi:hypothetical protein
MRHGQGRSARPAAQGGANLGRPGTLTPRTPIGGGTRQAVSDAELIPGTLVYILPGTFLCCDGMRTGVPFNRAVSGSRHRRKKSPTLCVPTLPTLTPMRVARTHTAGWGNPQSTRKPSTSTLPKLPGRARVGPHNRRARCSGTAGASGRIGGAA